jgi:4-hydroxybenzoate polyprenyltransferase
VIRSKVFLFLDTIKFAHTLFALPFAALAAFWARAGPPDWLEAALLLVAMVSARTAAMAFNRVADAELDRANPRTRDRAIPAGRLSRRSVAVLAAASAAVFLATAGAFYFYPVPGNFWPALLALPVLAVLVAYSYTKRFTLLTHFVLGLALGLSPVGVWIALTGRLALAPVLLGLAVMLWTAGFDILYSLQDLDHDRRSGLRSIPARLGPRRALLVARLLHLATVALVLAVYFLSSGGPPPGDRLGLTIILGRPYLTGALMLGLLLLFEHWLVRADDLRRLNHAFFTTNAAGSLLFALLGIADVMLK